MADSSGFVQVLKGKTFTWSVAGYTISVEFVEEDKIRWTYNNAPDEKDIGKTGLEDIERHDLHDGIVVIAWLEKDGTNVVDILDLTNMKLYANFVTSEGKRFSSQPAVTEEPSTGEAPSPTEEGVVEALKGKTFTWSVAGYTISVEIVEEDKIRWTYNAAPDEKDIGKTGLEDIERHNLHHGVVTLAWLEKDGTNVVDILDLTNMKLYANFVTSAGKRFSSQPAVTCD